jgi:hypothetical protein
MERTWLAVVLMSLFACASADPKGSKDAPVPAPKAAGLCEGAPTCGVDGPQCPEGTGCFSLAACETPVCVATEAACEAVCGTKTCAVMESHPMQIAC